MKPSRIFRRMVVVAVTTAAVSAGAVSLASTASAAPPPLDSYEFLYRTQEGQDLVRVLPLQNPVDFFTTNKPIVLGGGEVRALRYPASPPGGNFDSYYRYDGKTYLPMSGIPLLPPDICILDKCHKTLQNSMYGGAYDATWPKFAPAQ